MSVPATSRALIVLLALIAITMAQPMITSASGPPPGRLDAALSYVRSSEYHVGGSPDAPALANRAQGLRVVFRDGDAEISPWRDRDDDTWSLRLEMPEPVRVEGAPEALTTSSGAVRWSNRSEGIELRLSTLPLRLRARPSHDLTFHQAADGSVLRGYVRGRPVLEIRAAGSLTVRRDGDLLNVTGDPDDGALWIGAPGALGGPSGPSQVPDWIGEGNGTVAAFGESVATAGDFNGDGFSDVLVGAPDFGTNRGRAFLFRGTKDGLETIPIWIVDGETSNGKFGSAVAGAGDVNGDGLDDLLVGAPFHDSGQLGVGRVYLFLGGAPQPSATPDWTFTGQQGLEQLGGSLASAGDVDGDGCADVVIGAANFASPTAGGRVLVFHGCSDGEAGLQPVPDRMLTLNTPNVQFGSSVAGAGDVNADGYQDVIVGAPQFQRSDVSARGGVDLFNEGLAAVYHGSADGLSASPNWTVFGGVAEATLGSAVAAAGDVDGDGYADVIVGAPANNGPDGGSARLYAGGAGGLATSRMWSGTTGQRADGFGAAVATAGDVNGDGYADILVGAGAYDGGNQDEGAAFLYYGGSHGPRPVADWSVEGGLTGAELGTSVGTAGDVNDDGFSDLLLGAPKFALDMFSGGRAFVYLGAPRFLDETESWRADGSFRLGFSVATAGDFNGDGFSDIVAGAPIGGLVSIWAGSTAGLSAQADWRIEGLGGTSFGWVVGTAGDVNGDGIEDLIVGAPAFGRNGAVYVFYGGQSDPFMTWANANWSATGETNALFGAAAASAGDVNGDGYADVLAGAPQSGIGGQVFVWHGSADGLPVEPDWSASSPVAGASFGDAATSAGDINGDGFGDIIVGAFEAGADHGLAVVYLGSANGLSGQPIWRFDGQQSGQRFGDAVASAGDLNGDGFSDVVVGSPTNTSFGRIDVFLGSPSGPSLQPDWSATATRRETRFGIAVAAAGDVNGDGFGDLVIGEPGNRSVGIPDAGPATAFVYAGSPDGPRDLPSWHSTQPLNSDFGYAVATAGDVDGDGVSDLLIGARGPLTSSPGSLHLYYGNPGARGARQRHYTGGRTRPMHQLQIVDPATPIAPYGLSETPDGFRIEAVGRTAAGRGRIASRTEVATVGTGFDDARKIDGVVRDTGSPTRDDGSAVTVEQVVDGLPAATFAHWRMRFVSDSLFFPTSPWRSVPWNSITETKVRTGGPTPEGRLEPIGPGSNEPVFPDAAPLIFSWNRGPHSRFRLEWSSNTEFADRVEVSEIVVAQDGVGDAQVFIPDEALWRRILLLGRNADVRRVPIFWRVVPQDGPSLEAEPAISAIRMEPPVAPVPLSPSNGVVFPESQAPILNWEENHNERFRVVFSTSPGLQAPTVTSEEVDSAPLNDWDDTWAEVVDLSRSSNGQIYWAVFAEDAIGRVTWSDVRDFRVLLTDRAH